MTPSLQILRWQRRIFTSNNYQEDEGSVFRNNAPDDAGYYATYLSIICIQYIVQFLHAGNVKIFANEENFSTYKWWISWEYVKQNYTQKVKCYNVELDVYKEKSAQHPDVKIIWYTYYNILSAGLKNINIDSETDPQIL